MNDLGKNLKRLREEKRFTQVQLANDVGTTKQYISQLERGAANPGRKMVSDLCAALDCSEEELRFGKPPVETEGLSAEKRYFTEAAKAVVELLSDAEAEELSVLIRQRLREKEEP